MRDPPGRDWSRWVPHRKVRYFCAGTFFAFGASAFASVAASIVGRRSSVVVRTHGMVKICMHRVVRVEHPCARRVRLGVRMHAWMHAWMRAPAGCACRHWLTRGRTDARRDAIESSTIATTREGKFVSVDFVTCWRGRRRAWARRCARRRRLRRRLFAC